MNTFDLLMQGLQTAILPMNLLYALIGVTLGTAVGVLPGIGPATTVALLLPVTYKLDPAGSLIMFAGIYYGGMYGGSTTSILLNTPGESASIVTALEGNKMAARRPRRLGAGDRRDRLVHRRPDRHHRARLPRAVGGEHRARLRAARVFRADGAGLHHRIGGVRGIEPARADRAVPRADAGAGRHRHADRAGPADLRRAGPARRHRSDDAGGGDVRHRRDAVRRRARQARALDGGAGEGLAVDDARRTGRARGSRGCAARRSAFRSARCRPAAPRSARSFPTRSKRSFPSTRKSSATAPSKAWPGRKPPTTRRLPARWCRC